MVTTTRRRPRWGAVVVLGALILALVMALGGTPPSEGTAPEPATLEHVDGTELSRITLTEQAAARLDLTTSEVESTAGRLVVPSGAIIVDPDGTMWVYESPEQLVFVRSEVVIDRSDGDVAYLVTGPTPGTTIVTLGAAELYGVEHGIGH